MSLSSKGRFRHFLATAKHPGIFLFRVDHLRILLVLSVITLIAWAAFGPYFKIRRIDCQNQARQPCDANVVAELQSFIGKSTFLISGSGLSAKIEKANPAFREVVISAKLPDLLSVSMIDQVEYSLVKIATDSPVLVVDPNLLIVDQTTTPPPGKFTVISARASQVGVGDQLTDPALIASFTIGRLLNQAYIPFDSLVLETPANLKVSLTDGKLAVFSTILDLSRQVTSLQLILQKATIQKEPRVIDVRFDKPVLKY